MVVNYGAINPRQHIEFGGYREPMFSEHLRAEMESRLFREYLEACGIEGIEAPSFFAKPPDSRGLTKPFFNIQGAERVDASPIVEAGFPAGVFERLELAEETTEVDDSEVYRLPGHYCGFTSPADWEPLVRWSDRTIMVGRVVGHGRLFVIGEVLGSFNSGTMFGKHRFCSTPTALWLRWLLSFWRTPLQPPEDAILQNRYLRLSDDGTSATPTRGTLTIDGVADNLPY